MPASNTSPINPDEPTPEPTATRHDIDGTIVETVMRSDGWWLYRCPEILPVNARHWRGDFESQTAAIADLIEKRRLPRVTARELIQLRRNGGHSVVNGRSLIRHLDPLTGATVFTSYDLIDG